MSVRSKLDGRLDVIVVGRAMPSCSEAAIPNNNSNKGHHMNPDRNHTNELEGQAPIVVLLNLHKSMYSKKNQKKAGDDQKKMWVCVVRCSIKI